MGELIKIELLNTLVATVEMPENSNPETTKFFANLQLSQYDSKILDISEDILSLIESKSEDEDASIYTDALTHYVNQVAAILQLNSIVASPEIRTERINKFLYELEVTL